MIDIKSTLDAKWTQLLQTLEPSLQQVMWAYHLTPPIPSHWRLHSSDHLISYAYAMGHDFAGGLMDGVRVAAPWARIEKPVYNLESATITFLADQIQSIGIQGVRPISAEELNRVTIPIESEMVAFAQFPNLNAESQNRIQDFYREWLCDNGVIAQAIRPGHLEFFQWLDQGGNHVKRTAG